MHQLISRLANQNLVPMAHSSHTRARATCMGVDAWGHGSVEERRGVVWICRGGEKWAMNEWMQEGVR